MVMSNHHLWNKDLPLKANVFNSADLSKYNFDDEDEPGDEEMED